MRPRDRLATANWHGVEHASRLLGIVHKGGKERRVVAGLDTTDDVEMQLHEVFLVVEHTTANPEVMTSDILNRAIRDKVRVQLRAHAGDQTAQFWSVIFGQHRVEFVTAACAVQIFVQDFIVDLRAQNQTRTHHDRLNVMVEKNGNQRVL